MKKIFTILLALSMVFSLTACGSSPDDTQSTDNTQNTTQNVPETGGSDETVPEEDVPEENISENVPDEEAPEEETPAEQATALEVFTSIWNNIPEDSKPMSFGGDYNEENQVENAPGKHEIGDGSELDNNFGFPVDLADKVSEAAAIRHMLNVNSLSAAMYFVSDENKDIIPDLAQGIRDSLMNRAYMCGWPEVLVVMTLGDNYVMSAFGNTTLVYALRDAAEAYGLEYEVLFDESMENASGDNTVKIPVPELG